MIENGDYSRLGATALEGGVNFALYASQADAVELCLFDEAGETTARHFMPAQHNGVWNGFVPGCRPGQRYGYRVHGPWDPVQGLRHNPAKLLLDPYARRLEGRFRWSHALFDYDVSKPDEWIRSDADSAADVPFCVVEDGGTCFLFRRPVVPWSSAVVYEANVRGYTMRHPDIPEEERGRFRGMCNAKILEYLKALGITSLELMPVHTRVDEQFLVEKGLRNFWGYNSIQFFTPEGRLGASDPVGEFREMVNAIHDAGIDVILDVAYNHTAEGNERGPSLSFRGIDNQAYYRLAPGQPQHYINDTGCGNTLNTEDIRAQNLVLDSLRYWHAEMGVDGFRFDLATVLGRSRHGFSKSHALLSRISSDPTLESARLIAEPWDPGPGGYQLGRFPAGWSEWNDKFRDSVRRFWRGDDDQDSEFARRIHGSADLFETSGRTPTASVNLVSAHDGFTLMDTVSYEKRHNQANGEKNRDGHRHNFSCNCGVEGPTDEPEINDLRRRQRLNMLATLLFSQGVPMLLGGDEFGNSQSGNNNAYAQDNETGWLDWTGADADPGFLQSVKDLVHIRHRFPLLRQPRFIHGRMPTDTGWCDIAWLHPDGRPMLARDWNSGRVLALVYSNHPDQKDDSPINHAVAVLFNASKNDVEFELPLDLPEDLDLQFSSDPANHRRNGSGVWSVASRSLVLLASPVEF